MVTHLINNPNLNDAMKHTQSFNTKLPITLLATAILTACGGGGGTATITPPVTSTFYGTCGASSTVSQAAAQALCVPASVPIVTSIPATTYAAGSQEKAAFDYLNNARSTCGFGLLAQDTKLDAAAANHADYRLINNTPISMAHTEDASLYPASFTGVTPQARAAYAGYVGSVTEDSTIVPSAAKTASSVDSVRWLLSAPYHFRSLMEGYRDVGFSLKTTVGAHVLNIKPAYLSTAAKQQPTSGVVLTYPCQGIVDTAIALETETPWPIPGRASAIGQSVLIQVAEGSTLVLNTYSMTRTGGPGIDAGTAANGSVVGALSPLLKLDWSNDTNARFTNRYNVAMLMPDKTMYAGSTYRVQVAGTVNGTAFTKDFTFQTGGRADYDACLLAPGNVNFSGWQGANAYKIPYYCAQSAQSPDLAGPIILLGTKF